MVEHGQNRQKWSKSPKMAKIVNNGQNGLKSSKMVPNGLKWSKMVQNGPKWSKWLKMVKNGPNGQKWSKMVKNVQKMGGLTLSGPNVPA